jgi:hypothetical protein
MKQACPFICFDALRTLTFNHISALASIECPPYQPGRFTKELFQQPVRAWISKLYRAAKKQSRGAPDERHRLCAGVIMINCDVDTSVVRGLASHRLLKYCDLMNRPTTCHIMENAAC